MPRLAARERLRYSGRAGAARAGVRSRHARPRGARVRPGRLQRGTRSRPPVPSRFAPVLAWFRPSPQGTRTSVSRTSPGRRRGSTSSRSRRRRPSRSSTAQTVKRRSIVSPSHLRPQRSAPPTRRPRTQPLPLGVSVVPPQPPGGARTPLPRSNGLTWLSRGPPPRRLRPLTAADAARRASHETPATCAVASRGVEMLASLCTLWEARRLLVFLDGGRRARAILYVASPVSLIP